MKIPELKNLMTIPDKIHRKQVMLCHLHRILPKEPALKRVLSIFGDNEVFPTIKHQTSVGCQPSQLVAYLCSGRTPPPSQWDPTLPSPCTLPPLPLPGMGEAAGLISHFISLMGLQQGHCQWTVDTTGPSLASTFCGVDSRLTRPTGVQLSHHKTILAHPPPPPASLPNPFLRQKAD